MSIEDEDKKLEQFRGNYAGCVREDWQVLMILVKRLFMQEKLLQEFKARITYLEKNAGTNGGRIGDWWKKDETFAKEREAPLYPEQTEQPKKLSKDDLENELDTIRKRMDDLFLTLKRNIGEK